MLFLTREELVELTGRKRVSKQIEWLREHQFPHELTAAGRPVVLRAEVARRLSGETDTRQRSPRWDRVA